MSEEINQVNQTNPMEQSLLESVYSSLNDASDSCPPSPTLEDSIAQKKPDELACSINTAISLPSSGMMLRFENEHEESGGSSADVGSNSIFKWNALVQTIHNISCVSEKLLEHNQYFIQRLTEMDSAAATTRCGCDKMRVDMENKDKQLKQAFATISDLKQQLNIKNQGGADHICLRCRSSERQVVSLPCAHIGLCANCAQTAYNCFVCGRGQENILQVSFRHNLAGTIGSGLPYSNFAGHF